MRSLIDLDLATAPILLPRRWPWPVSQKVADPPASFGVIKARNLLPRTRASQRSDTAGAHDPRRKSAKESGLNSTDADDGDDTDAMDPFSSPVGGGGAVGQAAAANDEQGRQLSGSGSPGADTANASIAQRYSRRGDGHLDRGAAVGDRRRR